MASADDDSENDLLGFCNYFVEDEKAEQERRSMCSRCSRPITVCWCPYLPKERLDVKTNIYILQHPYETSRRLKTAPMLYQGLVPGKCHIIVGKKFSEHRYPQVNEILKAPNTLLLYPGEDAMDIQDLPHHHHSYNLVMLDGTWAQAKNLYSANKILSYPRKVQINNNPISKYVIRTQPTDTALSTLESAAVAISILEKRPEIFEMLTRPLEALCNFQMKFGAVQHQSKTYKIENGLWNKPLSKKFLKKREQEKLNRLEQSSS
ncbi:tRNA-uridine aminocarboxypropyltransferase 2-like [Ylistrum balloti]|uniref:tRNA-uridine aminocarboxypropyltransferase 2-like n=1 Tax=Ylistrum balloti TaxID=509963 RepID=UPI0029058D74|nr:tRNA-uridine aminocarboxypropyltransferase 2-like [Ylistrum balloti]